MGIAISTAGVYRTDDGGETWQRAQPGVRAEFLPDKHPEFGQCVHKVVHHPSRPERLFLQNHWGLYRSDDWGDSWQDIANGVPSDFGFADGSRTRTTPTRCTSCRSSRTSSACVPEAKLRVYRTQRRGRVVGSRSPTACRRSDAFETVLRDGLAADSHDPAGVYFGTRSGKLFGSPTRASSWKAIADALPPICCVKAAVVGTA